MKPHNRDIDFLNDDKFIEWRLLQTEVLEQYWLQYIEEHPECMEAMNEAIRKFKAVRLNDGKLPEATQEWLFHKITSDVHYRKTRRRKIWYWSAAACVALLIVSSIVVSLNLGRLTSSQPVIADAFVGQALPSNEIQLISGGKVVELTQNAQITLGADGKASVVEEANTSELALTENTMNRLIVPYGKRTTLQLADGTKVWLNSGTELEFPSKFAGNSREIAVKGEIYIEVAKSENNPFYVNTAQIKVRVLGTKFNISAYPESNENSVVLVEGLVEVNTSKYGLTQLVPGEMYSETPQNAGKTKVDVVPYTSWKDGVLIFDKTPISEVLKKIGRYYNVNFENHSDAKLSAKSCTGKLLLSDNLDEVMTSVSALSSTVYHKENDIVYIKNQ